MSKKLIAFNYCPRKTLKIACGFDFNSPGIKGKDKSYRANTINSLIIKLSIRPLQLHQIDI